MHEDFNYLLSLGAEGVFYLLLLAFTLHVFVLGYHWFSYGTSKQISTLALGTYLGGAAILFITIALSLSLF